MGEDYESVFGIIVPELVKASHCFAPREENGEWVTEVPFDGAKDVPMIWADNVAPIVDGILKGGEK